MTNERLAEIRERDAASADTWFKGPAGLPEGFGACGKAFTDRRWLIGEVDRLMNDIQELTCGDPTLVCPNCRPAAEPSGVSGESAAAVGHPYFLVTTVRAAGEDGLIGRLYLSQEQAQRSISAGSDELVDPIRVLEGAHEPRGDPTKRCQHDLLKPASTIVVTDTGGRCTVCLESWNLVRAENREPPHK